MKEESRVVENPIKSFEIQSPRVPAEGNLFAGHYYVRGVIRLPVTAEDCLYLPRLNMRTLAVRHEHPVPCRFTENIEDSGEVDIAITREGFLIPAAQGDLKTLQRLVRHLTTTYRILVAPYDVIHRVGEDAASGVSMIRLIPCGPPEDGGEAGISARIVRLCRPESDEFLRACMHVHRTDVASEFTRNSLDLLADLGATQNTLPKTPARTRAKRVVAPAGIQICRVADMERRIEREPARGGNPSGSVPTLKHLCEQKLLALPSKETVQRVKAMADRLPNFAAVIDYVAQKFEAQRLCRSPMRLPPLLLLGDAGVGKSHFCRMLTEALTMPFQCIALAGSSQELHITGLSKSWGSAGPSRFAEIMSTLPMANPLIMVDEIDKASDIKVQNALLQIFETETSAHWVDQYVEVPIDLSRVMFVATANDAEAISPVFLSRFEVFEIRKPSAEQCVAVFNSIYRDEQQQFGQRGKFHPALSAEVVTHLAGLASTPREARRILLTAMELAVIRTHRQQGSLRRGQILVQVEDLPAARIQEVAQRMGFV